MREASDDLDLLLIEDNPADVFFVKRMLIDDEDWSKAIRQVSGYRRKPLSRQMMDEILDEYFSS